LDEPDPSDIKRLAEHVKTHVVARRNARGGRSAAEHLIAALRCLYNHAVADGHLTEADNPARKVAKPRRLPSTRRAVPDTRLAEIKQIAATASVVASLGAAPSRQPVTGSVSGPAQRRVAGLQPRSSTAPGRGQIRLPDL